MKHDVSIVVVNYNTKALTEDCVNSILKNTKGVKYEIVIVDNASKDGSFKYLSNKYIHNKNVKLLSAKHNLGFTGGNNLGIKNSNGRYILLLNSDTLLCDNAISSIISYLERNVEIGIATCRLMNEDGSIQGNGGYFPTLIRVFSWMTIQDLPFVDRIIKPFHPHHTKWVLKNDNFYKEDKELDWVTGAFMVIRREVVDRIGFLDDDYFMYTEDTDYCFRAKSAGYKIMYIRSVGIIHLGGKSSSSEFPILSEFRGVKLFYRKHYPSWQYPVLRFFLKTGSLLRMVLYGVLGRKEDFGVYKKAFSEA